MKLSNKALTSLRHEFNTRTTRFMMNDATEHLRDVLLVGALTDGEDLSYNDRVFFRETCRRLNELGVSVTKDFNLGRVIN